MNKKLLSVIAVFIGIALALPMKTMAQGLANDISAPVFEFEGENLVITCATPGAEIFYAIGEFATEEEADNLVQNMPVSMNNTQYTAPIPVTSNIVVKAIAVMMTQQGESAISTLVYNYTIWTGLRDAIAYGADVLAHAWDSNAVDDDLKQQLAAYLDSGDNFYNNRATTDYHQAEAFTNELLQLAHAVEQIISQAQAVEPEPYAVLSDNNTVLTFYYDDQRQELGGALLANYASMSYWRDHRNSISKVIFDNSFANYTGLTNISEWFSECSNLTTIEGITNLNTSNVTNMFNTFEYCSGLTSLDVSGFNTSNVTIMTNMFHGCSGLTSLDLSSFNTAKVEDMYGLFSGCSNLTTIYVSDGWSTVNVTDGSNMFSYCTNLVGGAGTHYVENHTDHTYAHIDGGAANPGYFTRIGDEPWTDPSEPEPYAILSDNNTVLTFYYDEHKAERNGMGVGPLTYTYDGTYIRDLVRADWYEYREDITNVIFDASFANCTTLTSTAFWFYGCKSLTSIEGIQYLKTDNVTDMGFMFNGCSSLTDLDVSGFNTAKVEKFCGLFGSCSSLTDIDVSHFDTSNVYDYRIMFHFCSSLTELDVSNFDTSNATGMGGMFEGCSKLTKLDLHNFNTEKVFGMGWLFSQCTALTDLDISSFKTSSVGEMNAMFAGCSSLTSLDVSGFRTDNVTTMEGMFEDCSGLTSLDLSGFNTDNVTRINSMFRGCSSLTSLDLSGFNTENVTEMDAIFYMCSNLTSLNLSSFKTDNVTSMILLFSSCSSLTSLDLNSFKTDKVTEMTYMFSGCSNLKTIYVSDEWSTANVTDGASMFGSCDKLVGGSGTRYDENHIDHTYAHIDGGTANPGYFTRSGDTPWTEPDEPEPYAVLSDNNTVLTFYYDEKKAERNGMGVGPFEDMGKSINSGWYDVNEIITTVVFDDSFANCTTLTSTAYWFEACENLTTIIGINNLKTDNVSDVNSMFMDCHNIKSIDLSSLNFSNVSNMHQMFEDCRMLESINFNGVNTENVTNMSDLFLNCHNLKIIDLSSFNTSNVTNMSHMFCRCDALTTVYVGEEWTTRSVTNSERMFERCTIIVGGQGTQFDENHIDAAYAHIDGGVANPGYFTRSGDEPWTEPVPEPYIVLSNNNKVMTFYYDEKKEERGGIDLVDESWVNSDLASRLVGLVFDESFADYITSETDGIEFNLERWTSLAAIKTGGLSIPAEEYAKIGNPNLLVYVNEPSQAPEGIQNVVVNGMAQEIVLTNTTEGNGNWYCPEPFTAEKISYTRDFNQQTEVGISRGWESIALPFDVQSISHATQGEIVPFGARITGGKYFWLRGYSDKGLHQATSIEANKPYVISMPNNPTVYYAQSNLNGRITFSSTNVTVPATPDMERMAVTRGDITMMPAFQTVPQGEEVYAINVGQARGSYAEGSVFERELREVRPFEAFTMHAEKNGSRPHYIRIAPQSSTTGMESTLNSESSTLNSEWYDLGGRQLQTQPKAKGVYIQKGRKQVVR